MSWSWKKSYCLKLIFQPSDVFPVYLQGRACCEMPFLVGLLPFCSSVSPHERAGRLPRMPVPVAVGPLSASGSCIYLCFMLSIPLFPSSPSVPAPLCFFQFLLQRQNPTVLFAAFLPPNPVSAVKSHGDFISSYLLCLALRTALGIRHLPCR